MPNIYIYCSRPRGDSVDTEYSFVYPMEVRDSIAQLSKSLGLLHNFFSTERRLARTVSCFAPEHVDGIFARILQGEHLNQEQALQVTDLDATVTVKDNTWKLVEVRSPAMPVAWFGSMTGPNGPSHDYRPTAWEGGSPEDIWDELKQVDLNPDMYLSPLFLSLFCRQTENFSVLLEKMCISANHLKLLGWNGLTFYELAWVVHPELLMQYNNDPQFANDVIQGLISLIAKNKAFIESDVWIGNLPRACFLTAEQIARVVATSNGAYLTFNRWFEQHAVSDKPARLLA